MLIKSLEGINFEVALEDLYIKPFFNKEDGQKIESYCVCTNQDNVEFTLAKYSEKAVAKHMLHILALYQGCECPTEPVQMLQEINLCQDLFAVAANRLEKAKEALREGEK